MMGNHLDKLDLDSIDHIVMQASDLPATIKFYTEILGMTHSEFQPPAGGAVRQSLHFGAQKINLHDSGSCIVDKQIYCLKVIFNFISTFSDRILNRKITKETID